MFTDMIEEVTEITKDKKFYHFTTEELGNHSVNMLQAANFIRGFQGYVGFTSFEIIAEISLSEIEITLYKKDGYGLNLVELSKSCWLMDSPKTFASMLASFEKVILNKIKKEIGEWEWWKAY